MLFHNGHALAQDLSFLVLLDYLSGYVLLLHLVECFDELVLLVLSVFTLLHGSLEIVICQRDGFLILLLLLNRLLRALDLLYLR